MTTARGASLSSTETCFDTEGDAYDVDTESDDPRVAGILEVRCTGEVSQHCVSTGVTYLGRSQECDVVLPCRNVSALHLCFKASRDGVTVADLGTKNGTFCGPRHRHLLPHTPEDITGLAGLQLEIPGSHGKHPPVVLTWYPHAQPDAAAVTPASPAGLTQTKLQAPVDPTHSREALPLGVPSPEAEPEIIPVSQVRNIPAVPLFCDDVAEDDPDGGDSLADADEDEDETQCVASLPRGNSFTMPPLPSQAARLCATTLESQSGVACGVLSPPTAAAAAGRVATVAGDAAATPLQHLGVRGSPASKHSLEATLQMTMDATLPVEASPWGNATGVRGSRQASHTHPNPNPNANPSHSHGQNQLVPAGQSNGTSAESGLGFSSGGENSSAALDAVRVGPAKLDFDAGEVDSSTDDVTEPDIHPKRRVRQKTSTANQQQGTAGVADAGKKQGSAAAGISSGGSGGPVADPPRIMPTGILLSPAHATAIAALSGEIVSDPRRCTHLVTNEAKRTVKFLCAMSCCRCVVSQAWLERCLKEQRWVDTAPYVFRNTELEARFRFNIVNSLVRKALPVFSGLTFAITNSLLQPTGSAGLEQIIECGGGCVVRGAAPIGGVVVTCARDVDLCRELHSSASHFVSPEWVYLAALRQVLPTPEEHLVLTVKEAHMPKPAPVTAPVAAPVTAPAAPQCSAGARRKRRRAWLVDDSSDSG